MARRAVDADDDLHGDLGVATCSGGIENGAGGHGDGGRHVGRVLGACAGRDEDNGERAKKLESSGNVRREP